MSDVAVFAKINITCLIIVTANS